MRTIPHQHKKELDTVEVRKEKQNESNETRVNEMLFEYYIWFMKNNIEEFQMFCKFWNQRFAPNNYS